MAQPVKFYTDEHIPRAVVRGLRRRGIDVLSVTEAGRRGAPDQEQLAFARSEERVLVTHDHDFLVLHASGAAHAGIAFVPRQTSIGHIVRGLQLIHQALEAADMAGRVEYL